MWDRAYRAFSYLHAPQTPPSPRSATAYGARTALISGSRPRAVVHDPDTGAVREVIATSRRHRAQAVEEALREATKLAG
jgi:hypothetical protein